MNFKYNPTFRNIVINNINNNNVKVRHAKRTYNICSSTVYNWRNKLKRDGNLECYKKKSKITPEIMLYIRNYVLKRINFKYLLLIKNIKKRFGICISKSSIYDILKKMNIRKKKIKKRPFYISSDRYKVLKNKLIKEVKNTYHDIIFIDEVSIDTHLSSDYGWCHKGTIIKQLQKRKKIRYTYICAIDREKVIHYKQIKGTCNKEYFKEFLEELTQKTDKKVIFLDNAVIHHAKIVKKYCDDTGIKLVYNIPYSPEFNPIELVFSELKRKLRIINKDINNNFLTKSVNKCFKNICSKNLEKYIGYSHNLLFL